MEILKTTAQDHIFKDVVGLPAMPSSSLGDQFREEQRQNGIKSLYFFSTAILGWSKIMRVPHLELSNFIQQVPPEYPERRRRKVVLIPRDCFKSTLGSKSFPLWVLIQPDFCGMPGLEHRILLCSFAAVNAYKQVQSIQQQIERNEMLRWLYPEIVPDLSKTTWTRSNLLFPRQGAYGEDTIEAAGVDTHIVSRHYTVQIKDDLEDKQSWEQPTVRERVKTFYRSAEALFVEEQTAYDLLIGTRWGMDDVYSEIQANESESYEFLVRPLHWTREELERDLRISREEGKPSTWNMDPTVFAEDPKKTYFFFPELFPEESCRRVRAKQGSFMYSMLYLNNPKDPSLAEFKEDDIQRFHFSVDGDIIIRDIDGNRVEVPYEDLFITLFWDPALSEREQRRASRNAMVVMAADRNDRLFICEAWAEYKNPTFLYRRFIGFHQKYRVNAACIEDVAFQRILKYPLMEEMKKANYSFHVEDQTPIGDKDHRIRSLIPFVESHSLFVREGLRDILDEFRGFPVDPKKDLIDASAACLERISRRKTTSNITTGQATRRGLRIVERNLETRSTLTGY